MTEKLCVPNSDKTNYFVILKYYYNYHYHYNTSGKYNTVAEPSPFNNFSNKNDE